MGTAYLGTLDRKDPLYRLLSERACPGVGSPVFHVEMVSPKLVYRYTEEGTGTALIGKFFHRGDRTLRAAEYDNLSRVRARGLDTFPNYVVRPIARERSIGLALAVEYVKGKDLDHYIRRAAREGRRDKLKKRLSTLARFLQCLHSLYGARRPACLDPVARYFHKVVSNLAEAGTISPGRGREFLRLMESWLSLPSMQAGGVTVHGDATPTNFIFTPEGGVAGIDFERMKTADPVYDLGMIAAELKHGFFWRTGGLCASEPFIGHFYESYAGDVEEFRGLTGRNPFYMALAELRIARNLYLHRGYRKALAHEAFRCLRWGLLRSGG